MSASRYRGLRPHLGLLGMALAATVLGCVGSGAGAGTSQTEELSPSATPTATATPLPSGPGGFYLRAWETKAVEPRFGFTVFPMVTIAQGLFIDGKVAQVALYPPPLWNGLSASSISQKGIDTVVAEAQRQGLLNSASHDFAGAAVPGSALAHLEMVVDGTTYELTGDPTELDRCRCIPEPGTNAAFAAFWQRLVGLNEWLGDELGKSGAYDPERVAILVSEPGAEVTGITPKTLDWPLTTPFADFGSPFGSGFRCGVVSGTDLATLLPVVKRANQLTRFKDSAGASRSLLVRTLVPGEPSPCS